jgi:FixJ family two-component response regulator
MNELSLNESGPSTLENLCTVLMVEDDDTVRDSMRRILNSTGYRVFDYSHPADFLAVLHAVERVTPAVILLDMRLPEIPGVAIQDKLIEKGIQTPVVFISGQSSVTQAVEAIQKGAYQFLVKPVGRDALLKVVEEAMAFDRDHKQRIEKRKFLAACYTKLTPREKEVLVYVKNAMGNTEIGEQIGIAYATAKQYKTNILMKYGVTSVPQLITLFEEAEEPARKLV